MKEKLNLWVLALLAPVVIDSYFKGPSEAILKSLFQKEMGLIRKGRNGREHPKGLQRWSDSEPKRT